MTQIHEEQKTNRTLLMVIGAIVAVLIIGVAFVLTSSNKEAATLAAVNAQVANSQTAAAATVQSQDAQSAALAQAAQQAQTADQVTAAQQAATAAAMAAERAQVAAAGRGNTSPPASNANSVAASNTQ
jgi:hypothetical protein